MNKKHVIVGQCLIFALVTVAWAPSKVDRVDFWDDLDLVAQQTPAPFRAELSISPAEIAVGETINYAVSLINESGEEIVLAYSLDASDVGWRFPHVDFEITGPDGEPIVIETPRCGMMNPLMAEDLVVVEAGDSFDPFGERGFPTHHFYAWQPEEPGVYRIRFIYDTTAFDRDRCPALTSTARLEMGTVLPNACGGKKTPPSAMRRSLRAADVPGGDGHKRR